MQPSTDGGARWAAAGRAVVAAGLRWNVVEAGDVRAPTVVLAAGFPQSAYAWRRVVPLLAARHHVLAVDLPGQGGTQCPPDGFDTSTAARRLDELLSTLGVEQHVFVGHDVGAWVGFAHAHLHPQRVRAVVLVDANIPGVTLAPSIALDEQSWRSWHFFFNALPELPEALLTGREQVLVQWFLSHKAADWRATFTADDLEEYARSYADPSVMRGMLGYYRAVRQDAADHARLARTPVAVPVLAVVGEVGSAPDLPSALAPLCADSRGVVVPGCGHYVPEEAPRALSEAVSAFVAGLPDGGTSIE